MATYLVVIPISHGNGLMDTSIQHKPLSTLLKTTTDTDTLKTMLTTTHPMPHTATTITVRPLVEDTIFTLQAMQAVAIILTSTVTRTPVHIVTIICGQAVILSAQMR